MKPTSRQGIERRLSALENRPEAQAEEPLCIRVVEVDTDGKEVTEQWETTRYKHPHSGQGIVVHFPV